MLAECISLLEVRRALTEDADAPILVATFAVSRKRLDELESAGVVVTRYHQLEASRADLYQGYLRVFALLAPNVSRTNLRTTDRFAETSAIPGTGVSVS